MAGNIGEGSGNIQSDFGAVRAGQFPFATPCMCAEDARPFIESK
jgi:hypothetical protein